MYSISSCFLSGFPDFLIMNSLKRENYRSVSSRCKAEQLWNVNMSNNTDWNYCRVSHVPCFSKDQIYWRFNCDSKLSDINIKHFITIHGSNFFQSEFKVTFLYHAWNKQLKCFLYWNEMSQFVHRLITPLSEIIVISKSFFPTSI